MNDFFSSDGYGLEIVASIVVVILALAARAIGMRFIRSQRWATTDESRLWLVRLRNTTLLVAVFALLVVWADELRAAALTFLALGVAFVIATKELIMSLSGSLVRATSASFSVGDRVAIGAIRGIVIDHSSLTTTLLEIGPSHVRTGRAVVLPNSVFLSSPVVNESRGHEYVLHSFTVPVKRAEWQQADRILKAAADDAASPYVEEARRHMEERAAKYSIPVPTVEPFVLAKPTGPDVVEMTVRLPVVAREVWRIENDILRTWLAAADDPAAASTGDLSAANEVPAADGPTS